MHNYRLVGTNPRIVVIHGSRCMRQAVVRARAATLGLNPMTIFYGLGHRKYGCKEVCTDSEGVHTTIACYVALANIHDQAWSERTFLISNS